MVRGSFIIEYWTKVLSHPMNLANSAISQLLYWVVPLDSEYQNVAYNHPLTLCQVTGTNTRNQWSFVSVTS